jgi:pimeloyl-ACP methyl ester carboxylesterase
MQIRTYGIEGPWVVVLHGGPGAAGTMAPVARGLSDRFRVLEPFQRGSGGEPLTVARHVADLDDVIRFRCSGSRPTLVGSSWGAMLGLAYAAEHPGRVRALVLIGCGTFDRAARDLLRARVDRRMDVRLRRRLERLPREIADPDERLRRMGELILPLYSYDLITTDQEIETVDARAHHETWEDMVRLQDEGVYPAAFAAIECPVLMLHGALDPHPGRRVRASLEPFLSRLEYREWELCGHYPWLERAVREEFFTVLRDWLDRATAEDAMT